MSWKRVCQRSRLAWVSCSSSSPSDRPRTFSMSICQAFLDDDSGGDRQFVAGEAHCLDRLGVVDTSHLEEDPTRLDDGHPVVGRALAGTHSGLGGLLGRRLVREDADPDLAAALDRAGHGASGSLDLAARDPGRLEGGEAEVAKCDTRSALGLTGHPTALDLAMLDAFRHQHGYIPCPTAAGVAGAVWRARSGGTSPR